MKSIGSHKPARQVGAVVFTALLAGSLSAAEECTPLAEDIPVPVAVTIGLAGDLDADIGRYLMVQSATGGKLSKDGLQLAYLSNISGSAQIWLTELANPWPVQVTFGEPITFFEWTPDNQLVYGVDRGGNEREGFYLLTSDGLLEREVLAPSEAFRIFGGFNPDMTLLAYASTQRDGLSFDLHLVDLPSGRDRMIFEGRMGLYVDSFSPDASRVVLTEAAGEDGNHLYLYDLASGAFVQISDPDDRSSYANINWQPDGSGFYLTSNLGREFAAVLYYDIANGSYQPVHAPDAEVDGLTYAPEAGMLAWTENHGGFSVLYRRNLVQGDTTVISDLPRGVYAIDIAADTGLLAVSVSGPAVPGDIWMVDAEGVSQRVTFSSSAGLDLAQMIEPRHVSFVARDGVTLYGLLYLPKKTSRQTPFLLEVHGGPTAQARPYFNADQQYLLARGIGILDFNYRGSSGYGKSFARLNDQRLRVNELGDIEDAVSWLRQQSGVGVGRVGIAGGSYGGYLTMAALARLPNLFDAGVAMVGVSDWVSALEEAAPTLKASDVIEYGDIHSDEDREFFAEISPLAYADQVRAPLMLQHGANDPRDPPEESDRFACAVRAIGGSVEYLRFPDEGHGLRQRVNRITFYTRMADFLERHLGLE